MAEGIRVEGLKELTAKLRRIDRDHPKALTALHKKIAEPVARAARIRSPKRGGRLARSVRAGGSQKAAMIRAGTNIPRYQYAGVIHYGWPKRNIEAQPFLTDSVAANQRQAFLIYDRDLGRFLDDIWNSNPAV